MGQKLVLGDIFYAPKHGKFCNDMNLPVFLKCSVKFISNLFDKFLEMVTKIQQIEIIIIDFFVSSVKSQMWSQEDLPRQWQYDNNSSTLPCSFACQSSPSPKVSITSHILSCTHTHVSVCWRHRHFVHLGLSSYLVY